MRQQTMIPNGNDKLRGWFDKNEVPVRITPWKNDWRKRNTKRTSRPLKTLSPAIEALLTSKAITVRDLAA